MSDYQFPEAPELEKAWRAAYQAFESLIPANRCVASEGNLLLSEVISLFPAVVREANMTAAAEIGPPISWEAPPCEKDWDLIMSGIDLDGDNLGFGLAELNESAFEGPDGRWTGSALDLAGRAYQRECRWDFSPGEAGMWLLMLAPVSGWGAGDGPWTYTGHLAGFVIVYDRDQDGSYESVGHIWTARAWRRRGIARRLLAEAKAHFRYEHIEGPYTAPGAALIESCKTGPS